MAVVSKLLGTAHIDNKNDSVKVTVLQNHLSIKFLAHDHATCLKKHGFQDPDVIWAYEAEWFETPNRKRGGWSGVNFLSLDGQGYYLKRQENYQRHSVSHPFAGEPTYVREFEILQFLQDKPVQTPELVYFAQNQKQSIIITAELKGFVPADQWLLDCPEQNKQQILSALAAEVRALHQTGVVHRALFLKHLFIKPLADEFEVAIIDFEKARRIPWMMFSGLNDIKRCLQRATMLTPADKAYFLLAYWQTKQLNWWQRRVSQWLINASKEK